MRNARIRVPWAALAAVIIAGTVATLVLGAAAWQGLQIEASVPIDTGQPRSEVPLDIAASAFAFDPVVVTIDDKPKKSTKVVEIRIRLQNSSEKDYFVYATAILLDAQGQVIASRSEDEKADDHDHADLAFGFRLPYADAERAKTCKFRIAFEKE